MRTLNENATQIAVVFFLEDDNAHGLIIIPHQFRQYPLHELHIQSSHWLYNSCIQVMNTETIKTHPENTLDGLMDIHSHMNITKNHKIIKSYQNESSILLDHTYKHRKCYPSSGALTCL